MTGIHSSRLRDDEKLDYGIEKLSRILTPVSAEQDADAAVALLLKLRSGDFEILFVKRVENPADPWSGQMAFPGGKRDLRDRNLEQTVIRETLEETSIDLLDGCRFLGAMNTLRSTQKPEMKILPFVVLLQRQPSIKLNRKELERYVWIRVEKLFRDEGMIRFGSGEFPAYVVGRNVIWGLTYRILKDFERLLRI